jgi:hypothetical protein
MTKTLTLPLVWQEIGNRDGDSKLLFGPICVGRTMFLPRSGVWFVSSETLLTHQSTGHPTREAAQAALMEAVLALGVPTP